MGSNSVKRKIEGNYGLVFAGGGAKGAWQIGVWEALLKAEAFGNPAAAVAGTSVGALNATLYALSPEDIRHAETIWKKQIQETKIPAWVSDHLEDLPVYFCKSFCTGVTVFSNHGLANTIDAGLYQNGNEKATAHPFKMPIRVCAYNKNTEKSNDQQLPDPVSKTNLDICKNWLLASTAIPLFFPPIKIGGHKYSDGGILGKAEEMKNAPVDVLLEKENTIRKIFLFALAQDEKTYYEKMKDQKDLVIYPIMPSKPLGTFLPGTVFASLDFREKNILALIEQGKTDGKNWYNSFSGRTSISFSSSFSRSDALNLRVKNVGKIFDNLNKINDLSKEDFLKDKRKLEDIKKFINSWFDDHLEEEKQEPMQNLANEIQELDDQLYAEISGLQSHEKSQEQILKKLSAWIKKSNLPEEKASFYENILKRGELLLRLNNSVVNYMNDTSKLTIKTAIYLAEMKIQNFLKSLEKPELPQEKHRPSIQWPGDFLGREKELKELEETINNNSQKIILVVGHPLNGKKAFVYKYAKDHEKEFPGGCFEINASGKETFEEALRTLVTNTDVKNWWDIQDNDLSDTDAQTRCVYNKLTDDTRKKLLVVTNVPEIKFLDPEKVKKLTEILEKPNITILATMRQSVAKQVQDSYHIHQFQLKGLSEQDSKALLRHYTHTKDRDEILQEIWEKAGGLSSGEAGGNPWVLHMIGRKCRDKIEELENVTLEELDLEGKIENEIFKEFCDKYAKPIYNDLSKEAKEYLIYASLLNYDNICHNWIHGLFPEKYDAKKAKCCLEKLSLLYEKTLKENCGEIHWGKMLDNTKKWVQYICKDQLRSYAEKLCEYLAEQIKTHVFTVEETIALSEALIEWKEQEWRQEILPLIFSLHLNDDLGDYLTAYHLFDLRKKICEAADKVINSMPESKDQQLYKACLLIYKGHISMEEKNYDKASEHYQEAKEIRKKELGENAVETFLPLEYEASLSGKLKNLDDAERKYEQCKERFEKYLPLKYQKMNWGRGSKEKQKNSEMDSESGTINNSAEKELKGEQLKISLENLARLYSRWADTQRENGKDAEGCYRTALFYAKSVFYLKKKKEKEISSVWYAHTCRQLGVFYKGKKDNKNAEKYLEKSKRILSSLCSAEKPLSEIKKIEKDLEEIKSDKKSSQD